MLQPLTIIKIVITEGATCKKNDFVEKNLEIFIFDNKYFDYCYHADTVAIDY